MSKPLERRILWTWMLSAEGSPAQTSLTLPEVEREQALTAPSPDSGLKCDASSASLPLEPSSSKTSPAHGAIGCPSCGATYGDSDMPACRFECAPQTLVAPWGAPASSWLPTPTATSNASCPSMLKWPGHRRLSQIVGHGRQAPATLLEWQMGLPIGWTDVEP